MAIFQEHKFFYFHILISFSRCDTDMYAKKMIMVKLKNTKLMYIKYKKNATKMILFAWKIILQNTGIPNELYAIVLPKSNFR